MKLKNVSALAAGAVLAVQASAVTLTFDDLAAGAVLSTQYSALGATFSPNFFSGPGSSTSGEPWATNTDMTIVSSTGADVGGLGTPALVSGSILHSFNNWFGENGDASFLISFSTPVTSVSATFAGVSTAADVTMWAFNGSTLLGTVSGTQVGQFVLTLNGANITSVAVRPGSFDDWVGVDNIVFAPIPEPGTYGMMALGLVGIGLLMRRRQRA
jgi:PEP-CTERM motif